MRENIYCWCKNQSVFILIGIFAVFGLILFLVNILPETALATEGRSSQSCTNIASKIRLKSSQYSSKRSRQAITMGNIQSRVTSISNKLKSAGHDTSQIDSLVETLKKQISEFNKNSLSAAEGFSEMQNSVCSSSGEQSRERLRNIKSAVKETRERSTSIKSTIVQIKDELNRIQGEVK